MSSLHTPPVRCGNRRCRRPIPAWVGAVTRRHFGRPLCILCTPAPQPRGTVIDVTHLVTGPQPVPVLLREKAL